MLLHVIICRIMMLINYLMNIEILEDKIGFLPQWFENGEIIVQTYIRLAEGFELDCDSLILFENCNCIGIVRYVKDFPPEYYQKKEAYETRKANAERDDDDLPF